MEKLKCAQIVATIWDVPSNISNLTDNFTVPIKTINSNFIRNDLQLNQSLNLILMASEVNDTHSPFGGYTQYAPPLNTSFKGQVTDTK